MSDDVASRLQDLARQQATAMDDYLAPLVAAGVDLADYVMEAEPMEFGYTRERLSGVIGVKATQRLRLRLKTDEEKRAERMEADGWSPIFNDDGSQWGWQKDEFIDGIPAARLQELMDSRTEGDQ